MNDTAWTATSIVVAGFVLAAGVGVLSSYVSSRRLAGWARRDGFIVLKQRAAPWAGSDLETRGGFAGMTFYVTVEDREKNVFNAWVRVGGIIAALRGAPVQVEWDNRPAYLRP